MDHRPGLFGKATGVLIFPERIAAPQTFIRSRLAAWRSAEGVILPGHWSSLLTDAAATKTARHLVATRHGRAGAALLRPGERALTAQRITDHGRAARPPASPATRAAAQTTLGAALADRADVRPRRAGHGRPGAAGSTVERTAGAATLSRFKEHLAHLAWLDSLGSTAGWVAAQRSGHCRRLVYSPAISVLEPRCLARR